jgi:hypothetical protein
MGAPHLEMWVVGQAEGSCSLSTDESNGHTQEIVPRRVPTSIGQEKIQTTCRLFVSESHHGIDSHGSPGWEIGGE